MTSHVSPPGAAPTLREGGHPRRLQPRTHCGRKTTEKGTGRLLEGGVDGTSLDSTGFFIALARAAHEETLRSDFFCEHDTNRPQLSWGAFRKEADLVDVQREFQTLRCRSRG